MCCFDNKLLEFITQPRIIQYKSNPACSKNNYRPEDFCRHFGCGFLCEDFINGIDCQSETCQIENSSHGVKILILVNIKVYCFNKSVIVIGHIAQKEALCGCACRGAGEVARLDDIAEL